MIYLSQSTINRYEDSTLDNELRSRLIRIALEEKSKVKLGGSVSYVQQVPWIQNRTIRENILFGLPLDEDRYNNTIEI